FETVRVALKVGYLGWDYHGAQRTDNLNGVEDRIFEALEKVNLIESKDTCEWSRCGRTDRGVSASTQIYSLKIRGAKKSELDLEKRVQSLDYILNALNSALPRDIFVYAYAIVFDEEQEAANEKKSFDARFSCKSRSYKYFFDDENLNIP
ncbi:MAG: tRNA pseudouridine synthase 3, partial [Paramarteilia canceri]